MTAATTRSRPGSWIRRGVTASLVLLLAALLANVGWRYGRWDAELEGVRFTDHREKISSHAAAVTVIGYLVATVRSDVDFFELAQADGAHPRVLATLCGSGKMLDAWPAPMPAEGRSGPERFSYSVLIPMRGAKVDLSTTLEDVCVRFQAATGAPLSWVKSKAVIVPLGRALRDELASYSRSEGAVQLTLDEACTPTLCQPDFSMRDLRP